MAKYRILLTDRPVGEEALERWSPGSARELAERGELLGVLIEYDPSERENISFVELERPRDEYGVSTHMLSDVVNLWRRIDARPNHFGGELRLVPPAGSSGVEAALSFETLVLYDPVVSVLTGAEARDSARPGRRAPCTRRSWPAISTRPRRLSIGAVAACMTATTLTAPERQFIGNFLEALREPSRVVIRQRSAQVMTGGEGLTLSVGLALEDGQWRLAD
jgi:hypothetical protein